MVHVKSDNRVRSQRSALQQQQVSGQLIGQVGLPGAAGTWQDDSPVLLQQGDIALQHWLWNQSVKDQRVHIPAGYTWKKITL